MNSYTVTYEVRYKGENPGPHIIHVFVESPSQEYAESQALRILNRENDVESAKLVYTWTSCIHCKRLISRYADRPPFEIRCKNGHLVELGNADNA